MVKLTTEQGDDTRVRLEQFLQDRKRSDQELAVQGLRGNHGAQRRTA
jgi:hypothetical protein